MRSDSSGLMVNKMKWFRRGSAVNSAAVPTEPEESDRAALELERAYIELLSQLFRGQCEVTKAEAFRPVAAFLTGLPSPPSLAGEGDEAVT